MSTWLFRRISANCVVLFMALVINFLLPRLMPGDPLNAFTGGVKLTVEARQAIVERFGLDESLAKQFLHYAVNAFRGDLGMSFYYFPKTVWSVIANALPWTLLVIMTSLLLQVTIGYLLGVFGAWRAGSKIDSLLQGVSIIIFSAPLFWIAMVLLYGGGYLLGWFPLGGAFTPASFYENAGEQIADIARHACLPILSLTIAQYASYQLILRNTMVSVLKEQYIITAEAKGLSDRCIKHHHAARNALLPMITFLGLSFSFSMGGSVFIETVFSYPGVGKLIYDSVICRDYPVLQGSFFLLTLVVIFVNLGIDILYRFLDPRIRY